ncbi:MULTISPECIES: Flp pilus assembly protein CpaB [unclassified Brenneria]|uniref:Flp pilus assembly protein CpaB n=1 Tax=unclassified Brenneria TaxID=2634434 RepID=UPI0018F07600|nr:Flp pilus assembly protein CpaB [Brenneria sp. L3-3C-1]MBJ7222711.1 Flp pilus assembly protein CpaB [Brenneria sp. L3-3C-1]MEE3643954.1 Flp pilus assembly protein CpaB [Brenneria sp. L3_3C_1]
MSSVLKLALILLAAALLAALARMMFVTSEQSDAPPEQRVQVRITAAALPEGLLLREGDLGWQAYPENKVPEGALTADGRAANLNGALLRKQMAAGTLILESDVIRPDAPGFLAAVLKPGMRAVSVPVDEVSGNAGLIQPGDFVDIILTQRLRQDENNPRHDARAVVSETVVERVRIIAVGSSIQRKTEDNGKPIRAGTVTIEVAPRAAEAVTVAAQLGSLSMALRSFAVDERDGGEGDAQQQATASVVAWDKTLGKENRPIWGGDVSRALGNGASASSEGNARPLAPRQVVIMRGSQRQEQEFSSHAR